MTTLPGIKNLGVDVNSSHLGRWPEAIGKFILNFAGIELQSYVQLLLLEPSRSSFNRHLDLLLSKRITRLQALLSSTPTLDDASRKHARMLWEEVRTLSVWRNKVAHNPVLPTWKPGSDADRDPPDIMGIPDFRQYKLGPAGDSIPLGLLDRMVDDSCALGLRVHELTRKLRGEA